MARPISLVRVPAALVTTAFMPTILVTTSVIACIPAQNLIAMDLLGHQQRGRLDVRAKMRSPQLRMQSASLQR